MRPLARALFMGGGALALLALGAYALLVASGGEFLPAERITLREARLVHEGGERFTLQARMSGSYDPIIVDGFAPVDPSGLTIERLEKRLGEAYGEFVFDLRIVPPPAPGDRLTLDVYNDVTRDRFSVVVE